MWGLSNGQVQKKACCGARGIGAIARGHELQFHYVQQDATDLLEVAPHFSGK